MLRLSKLLPNAAKGVNVIFQRRCLFKESSHSFYDSDFLVLTIAGRRSSAGLVFSLE